MVRRFEFVFVTYRVLKKIGNYKLATKHICICICKNRVWRPGGCGKMCFGSFGVLFPGINIRQSTLHEPQTKRRQQYKTNQSRKMKKRKTTYIEINCRLGIAINIMDTYVVIYILYSYCWVEKKRSVDWTSLEGFGRKAWHQFFII